MLPACSALQGPDRESQPALTAPIHDTTPRTRTPPSCHCSTSMHGPLARAPWRLRLPRPAGSTRCTPLTMRHISQSIERENPAGHCDQALEGHRQRVARGRPALRNAEEPTEQTSLVEAPRTRKGRWRETSPATAVRWLEAPVAYRAY